MDKEAYFYECCKSNLFESIFRNVKGFPFSVHRFAEGERKEQEIKKDGVELKSIIAYIYERLLHTYVLYTAIG